MSNLVVKETLTSEVAYGIDVPSGAVPGWYPFPQEAYFASQEELQILTYRFLCISQTDASLSAQRFWLFHLTEGSEAM